MARGLFLAIADVFWAVINSPFSRFAEAIRSIKLAIDLNNGSVNGKPGHRLYLVASQRGKVDDCS